MTWRDDSLTTQERIAIALGLWIVDTVGFKGLIESYDADGDRLVSRSELLADVRLDERPLGRVLLDAEALDREAIKRRLGSLAPLISRFFP